jgi:hypothetical protein
VDVFVAELFEVGGLLEYGGELFVVTMERLWVRGRYRDVWLRAWSGREKLLRLTILRGNTAE